MKKSNLKVKPEQLSNKITVPQVLAVDNSNDTQALSERKLDVLGYRGQRKALNIQEVQDWLYTSNSIIRNSITGSYETQGIELKEEDLNTIYITAKKLYPTLSKDLLLSILFSNHTQSYNPILSYLEVIIWDKKDRVIDLCNVITTDTGDLNYRVAIVQAWLLGIIESVYIHKPNVLQLIFAGLQNTGKSHFFINLLPAILQNYFAYSQLDKGKDDEILMCQSLLILDDEYSGKSKQDAKMLKRLQSAESFSLRPPYGKTNVKFKRLATLCATSNETELLNDPTGNR